MNLLEALKQIAEHSDKDERQYFMPSDEDKAGLFPRGHSGSLFGEMWRQTSAAQRGPPESLLRDVRMNPDAVARFIREQEPSQNIENRRNDPPAKDEPYSVTVPDDLVFDPNDPLAQLLGINSIDPRTMTENIPLPRPRPRPRR